MQNEVTICRAHVIQLLLLVLQVQENDQSAISFPNPLTMIAAMDMQIARHEHIGYRKLINKMYVTMDMMQLKCTTK